MVEQQRNNKRVFRALRPAQLIFVGLLIFFTLSRKSETGAYVHFSGQTMGTFYRITARHDTVADLQKKVDERLVELNELFSVFLPDSEVGRFNNHISTAPFPVSGELFKLVKVAHDISVASFGAYDITVNPLLRLWGFRPGAELKKPADSEIERVLSFTGHEKLLCQEAGYLQKKVPDLQIDLGSIAKGYGVDVIAELLIENGVADYLVEIGGEIRTRGLSPAGRAWRVGINLPEKTAALDELFAIVEVSDMAVATSGNYRNYIESGDESWAHILDPRTGVTAATNVLSVTVLATECFLADALATAAIVSGLDKAVLLFEKFPVEWYLIFRDSDGKLKNIHSDGFVFREVAE